MSFFVVPSVSYQTQQKLKSHKEKKKAKEKKKESEKELKRDEHRHDSDVSSIMSKGKRKKPGWGLLHRTSTSSKTSTDMRDDPDYTDDVKSLNSTYTTNPPVMASDPEGTTSDVDDWESLYSEQVSKSKSFTNLAKARSEEPEVRRFNLDEVLSEGEGGASNESKSEEQTPSLDSPTSSSTNMTQASSVASRRGLPEQAEREDEMSILIANSYGKTFRTEEFKPLGSHGQQSSPSPRQPSTPAISPLTPIVHSATFHGSSPSSIPNPRPRTNSSFTATSAPSSHSHQRYPSNAAFHRNSSSSSSNTTQSQPPMGTKESSSKFKKLHFLTSNTKKKGSSSSLPSSPGPNSPRQSPGSTQASDSYFPDMSNQSGSSIPLFNTLLDLSVLNSYDAIKHHFLNPQYLVFRYDSFLSLLSECHSSDAIHFANIRNQSLLRFIARYKRAKEVVDERGYYDEANYPDLHSTECILAYFMYYQVRCDMRNYIRLASKNHQLANHEELIHLNYINYIRYLVRLPEVSNVDILSDDLKRHYENKRVFDTIGNALFALKHDISSDVSSEYNKETKARLLVECVTKVSYEFILLEKYRFDMISKYNSNHLISGKHLTALFGLYRTNVTLNNKESIKVLLFNASNSAQYGWYHAITAPFVRFVETSVYAEDMGVLQDYAVYQKLEQATIKTDFTDTDNKLYNDSVSKLNLSSFQEYNAMGMDSLVALSRKTGSDTNLGSSAATTTPIHKPRNFEFYSQSLASIPSNSFNLIHTTDLPYQVKRENYKTVLREFHRIVKPGGSVITDSIHFGSRSTHEFLHEHVKGNFPRAWNYTDFSVSQHFEVIPNFVETILIELNSIFGKGNVKFGITLFSSRSEVNYFLAKFGGLKLFEMIGKLGEYCNYFEDDESIKSRNESSVHFQVHIEAVKRA